MKKIHPKNQEGMAILISVLLVGVMLSIVFALSAIFIPKIRAAVETKNSVPAAYAAESGLEWCLYVLNKGEIGRPIMDNGSDFEVSDDDCTIAPVKSTGTYRGVTRAFEISF